MNRTRGRLVVACLAVVGCSDRGRRRGCWKPCGDTDAGGRSGPRSGDLRTEHRVHGDVLERRQLDLHARHVHDGAAGDPGDRRDRHVREGVLRVDRLGWRADVRLRATQVRESSIGSRWCGTCRLETRSVGCTDCLVANGTWLIKESKSTNGNETFPQAETADLIGSSATEPVNKQLRAGGYEITGCTTGRLEPEHEPGGLEEQPRGVLVLPARILHDRDRSRARDHDHGDSGRPSRGRRCASQLSVRTARPALARTSGPPAA